MSLPAFVSSAMPLAISGPRFRGLTAFAPRQPASTAAPTRRRATVVATFDPLGVPQGPAPAAAEPCALDASSTFALLSLATAGVAAFPLPALAEVPEGVKETFKSIPASLVHPGMMWTLFALSLYAGWLGWQSRSIRSVDAATRKALVKSKVTLRHFAIASTLLATMTIFTFEGMANTYNRAGKLFPGPHLYAGLGLVALMTTTAAMVPYMQRGDNWARNAHLAFGISIVGVFAWQANTGMQIVGKLLKWT